MSQFFVCFFQAGDVAFSVPSGLVVTLERVLGNETVGKVLEYIYISFLHFCTLFLFLCDDMMILVQK